MFDCDDFLRPRRENPIRMPVLMIQYMRLLEDSVRVTPLFGPLGWPLYSPPGGPRALYQRGYAPRMEVVDLVRVAVKYGVQKICHNCRIIVRFARQK